MLRNVSSSFLITVKKCCFFFFLSLCNKIRQKSHFHLSDVPQNLVGRVVRREDVRKHFASSVQGKRPLCLHQPLGLVDYNSLCLSSVYFVFLVA